jgi:hypothetical protein
MLGLAVSKCGGVGRRLDALFIQEKVFSLAGFPAGTL